MENSSPIAQTVLYLLTGCVAALYSSVGHGGASGYLAILSFYNFSPAFMSSTALILNIVVATISAIYYFRAGHFSWSVCWPFLVASIPAAYLGGLLHIEKNTYSSILALTLLLVACRLFLEKGGAQNYLAGNEIKKLPAFFIGGAIGFLSGVVGIGGGVFLTPLLLLLHWCEAKTAAGISAVFIVVNSLSGLAARFASGQIEANIFSPLIICAFIGGLLGSRFGAYVFSTTVLRRILATVLLIAAFKLIRLSG